MHADNPLGSDGIMRAGYLSLLNLMDKTQQLEFAVIPLRNMVLFPDQPVPLQLGRESSIETAKKVFEEGSLFIALAQKSPETEEPGSKDLYRTGTLCRIVKLVEVPGGEYTAFTMCLKRVAIKRIVRKKGLLTAQCDILETVNDNDPLKVKAAMAVLDEVFERVLDNISPEDRADMRTALSGLKEPANRAFFIAMQAPLEVKQKEKILATVDFLEMLVSLSSMLNLELEYLSIRRSVQERAHHDLTESQKQQFMEQQIRVMQDEIGGSVDNEINELYDRGEQMKWDDETNERFIKEVQRLERFNPTSPDYAVQYAYVDTLLSLPWGKYSEDKFDLAEVEKILDRDHYGLREVKDRIVEQMAVMLQKGEVKGNILCLYGPPGVGKTSLGKSIAEAMKRQYVRVSFGGLHDEAEIRGHRRTYLGSMPGRIIAGLQKSETSNPVFVLDEIDKIGVDIKGDPQTALLEVLDPEQNMCFHDNYIDVDYDLSKVLFIATANTLSTISKPLLDRMELIEITGYIPQEKLEIAKRHLLPKQFEAHGLKEGEIAFTDEALLYIVDKYTRESGVRLLDKQISKILRKIIRLKMSDKPYPAVVGKSHLQEFLGKKEIFSDIYENNDTPGVVTGLAWTSVGGEILFIESSLSDGKGEKLTLTGNLGDVMKESAVIALQYLKAHAEEIGIDKKIFTEKDVHIHVPEGAIPKDGPSAGITMLTSLASAFKNCKVRERIAMTGEMTLRGKVLPVGGVKEKILAAKRAGITDIILSRMNERDIEEIDDMYLEGLTFHYVDTAAEVLQKALLDNPKDSE